MPIVIRNAIAVVILAVAIFARSAAGADATDGAPVTTGSEAVAVQHPDGLSLVERQRLVQLEGRWRLARWAILGLGLGLAVAGAVAAVARRRERGARHYARSMAQELEDKRRTGLAERQQAARRIVELEDRLRHLEARMGSRDRPVPRSA